MNIVNNVLVKANEGINDIKNATDATKKKLQEMVNNRKYNNSNKSSVPISHALIVQKLHIMMDLNSSSAAKLEPTVEETMKTMEEKPKSNLVEFSFSMMDVPAFKETPLPQIGYSAQPLYSNMVLYPVEMIRVLPYAKVIQFFFNETQFNDLLQQYGTNWVDLDGYFKAENADILMENEQSNIMLMLEMLLPIDPKMNQVLMSSYDHLIMERTNPYVVGGVDVAEALNFFGILETVGALASERGVYLKLPNGQKKAIAAVMWTNDLVNHPKYHDFLEKYNQQISNLKVARGEVETVMKIAKTDLMKELEILKGNKADLEELLKRFTGNIIVVQVIRNSNLQSQLSNDKLAEIKFIIGEIVKEQEKKKQVKPFNESWTIPEGYKLAQIDFADHTKYSILRQLSDNDLRELMKSEFSDGKLLSEEVLKKYLATLRKPNILGFIYSLQTRLDKTSASSSRATNYYSTAVSTDTVDRYTMTESIGQAVNSLRKIDSETDEEKIADYFLSGVSAAMEKGRISYGEYESSMKKCIDFSATILAGLDANVFIEKGIAMNMSSTMPDGTNKPKIEQVKLSNLRKSYPTVSGMNEDLEKVMNSTDRSSNAELSKLIERTRKGNWKDAANPGNGFMKEKMAFRNIYNRYSLGYPLHADTFGLEKFMYTGVDIQSSTAKGDVIKADDPTKDVKNGRTTQKLSIYVRMVVVDKNNFLKNKDAQCSFKNDSLLNMAKFLLNSRSLDIVDMSRYPREYNIFNEFSDSMVPPKNVPPPNPPKNDNPPPPPKSDNPPKKSGGKFTRHRKHFNRPKVSCTKRVVY
jgi:hypothetical protein